MGTSNRSLIQKYNPFEIVVDTNIAGDSGVGNYTLLLNPTGTDYRYYVDWGDGSISASTSTTNLTHSYSVPGFYNVKVYGRFDALYSNNTNEADKITDVISWGNVKWRNFIGSFYGCSNLTGMTISPPITEKVTNMSNMFNSATNFNQDIGYWDVGGVTGMSQMLNNTAVDVTNYNNILTGWTGWDGTGATISLQSNVIFGASGRQYSLGSAAEDARNYLITGLTWTITDAGGV